MAGDVQVAKRELAIVFDDYSVRMIEAKVTGGEVKKVYGSYLKEDVRLFREGILDLEIWRQILAEVKASRIFKAKRVHIVLPTSVVILREKELPDLRVEQLKAIVAGELASTSLFPFSDPLFDLVRAVRHEPCVSRESDNLYNHILVAAPGSIINAIVNSLTKERFKPITIDIAANSMLNYCKAYAEPNEHAIKLLAQVTEHGFDIHIFDNEILYFTRHIPKEIKELMSESGWLDEVKLAEVFVYEIERAKSYFNFTMNYRDRVITRIGLVSGVLLTERFLERVKAGIELDISFLSRAAQRLPRSIRQYNGYELALGALLRGVEK